MIKSSESRLILAVDDEPKMTRFIRMNLELEGYRVSEATNGMDALAKTRDELPDLVLLDVMMPDMNGWEVAQKILDSVETILSMKTK